MPKARNGVQSDEHQYNFKNMTTEAFTAYLNALGQEEKVELVRMLVELGVGTRVAEQAPVYYVQKDKNNRIVGVSQLSGHITIETHGQEVFDLMREIQAFDADLIGKFDLNGEFVDAEYFIKRDGDIVVDVRVVPEGEVVDGFDRVTEAEYNTALSQLHPPEETALEKRLGALECKIDNIVNALTDNRLTQSR